MGFPPLRHREGRGPMRLLRDRRKVQERSYEVKEIWYQHNEIIRLIVLGYGNGEIAEMTGYTPQTISNIRNSPIVRERVDELMHGADTRMLDIQARVREFEPIALEHLERIILGEVEGVSPALRAKTCENYLARGGHGPVQKLSSVSTSLSREDIEELKRQAKNVALEQGAMEAQFSTIE